MPRVPGHPLLKNLLQFWQRPVGFFVDAYRNHGPVFRFDLPTSHSTVIGGDAARDFLLAQDRATKSAGRCPMSRTGLFRPFAEEVGLPVFDAEGEEHKMLRELIRVPYSRQVAAQFVPEMDRVVAAAVAEWLPGQSVDLLQTTCRLSLHTMMSVVTPINLRSYTDDIITAGNRVMHAQFRLLPEASLKTPDYLRARDNMRTIVDEAIDRHVAGEFATEPNVHLVDACLNARASDGRKMDKAAVRGVCFYALAGTEIYMGRLSCFLIYELLKNRAYLQRVLAEIDSTSVDEGLANAFRRMPALRAVYQETLRCYPLIPGYSYVATADTQVAGHHVRKGEPLVFAPYLGHYSEEHYANPTAFDPDRHNYARREFARSRLFVPFGVGSHACAAPGLVEIMVLSLVTAILRRVDLHLEQPTHPMNLRLNPLISPAETLRVRVTSERVAQPRESGESHLAEIADFHHAQSPLEWLAALPEKDVEDVAAGERLIEQGAHADSFFVLVEGRMAVLLLDAQSDGERQIAIKDPGSCFGEIGLLKDIPRTASVVAMSASKVFRFSRAEFQELIGVQDLTADDIRSLYYARYIRSVLKRSLSGLSEALAPESMQWRHLAAGEYMFRQGEPSDAFYVVVEGIADVVAESGETGTPVAELGPGMFFGEIGILKSQPRGASVLARTPLKTLRIPRAVFLETLREHPQALSDLALITCQRLLAQVKREH